MTQQRWRTGFNGLFARFLQRFRVLPAPTVSVLDLPDQLPRNTAVIVRKGDVEQWLAFDCPCRLGHRVMLNLDRSDWPAWTIHTTAPLTLTPSVDESTVHGRCHYVIKKGRIRWV